MIHDIEASGAADEPAASIGAAFRRLADAKIQGGCDQCDAYQTMHTDAPGVFRIVVHHDGECPFLLRRSGGV